MERFLPCFSRACICGKGWWLLVMEDWTPEFVDESCESSDMSEYSDVVCPVVLCLLFVTRFVLLVWATQSVAEFVS